MVELSIEEDGHGETCVIGKCRELACCTVTVPARQAIMKIEHITVLKVHLCWGHRKQAAGLLAS